MDIANHIRIFIEDLVKNIELLFIKVFGSQRRFFILIKELEAVWIMWKLIEAQEWGWLICIYCLARVYELIMFGQIPVEPVKTNIDVRVGK